MGNSSSWLNSSNSSSNRLPSSMRLSNRWLSNKLHNTSSRLHRWVNRRISTSSNSSTECSSSSRGSNKDMETCTANRLPLSNRCSKRTAQQRGLHQLVHRQVALLPVASDDQAVYVIAEWQGQATNSSNLYVLFICARNQSVFRCLWRYACV